MRAFQDKDVSEELITKLLEAARIAPSASNRQEWRFVVVRDADKRRKLAEAAQGQKFVAQAPVVLACCAETDSHAMACGQLCYPIDVAIAIDHLTLEYVPTDKFTEKDLNDFRKLISQYLPDELKFDFKKVNAVKKTRNGKIRPLISLLEP